MSGFFISRHLVYCIVQIYFLKSSICFQGKMYICNVLFRIDFRFGEITDEKGIG